MPRRKINRKVGYKPKHKGIEGVCCHHSEILMTIEELEALRLSDILMYDQLKASKLMGISRGTFQRVLRTAREKSALALLLGTSVSFQEGNSIENQINYSEGKILIAIAVDNNLVSEHFGKCEKFKLYSIEDGKINEESEIINNWKTSNKKDFILIKMGVDLVITIDIGKYAKEILDVYGVKVKNTNNKNPREVINKIIEDTNLIT